MNVSCQRQLLLGGAGPGLPTVPADVRSSPEKPGDVLPCPAESGRPAASYAVRARPSMKKSRTLKRRSMPCQAQESPQRPFHALPMNYHSCSIAPACARLQGRRRPPMVSHSFENIAQTHSRKIMHICAIFHLAKLAQSCYNDTVNRNRHRRTTAARNAADRRQTPTQPAKAIAAE